MAEEITRYDLDNLQAAIHRYDDADTRVMGDWSNESLREYYHAAHYLNRQLRRLADMLLRAALRDVEARERVEEAREQNVIGARYCCPDCYCLPCECAARPATR